MVSLNWEGQASWAWPSCFHSWSNVGCWLTSGDLALDSCAQFLAIAGAPPSLPSFVTPQFQEFFRLGWVLRTTLPTKNGGVVHLFVVYGYQEGGGGC